MRNFTEIEQVVRTYENLLVRQVQARISEVCAVLHVLASTLLAVILNKRPQTAAKM